MREHAIKARENLFKRLEDQSVTVLYSGHAPHRSADQNYDYTPQRNFFYVTNLSEPNMILMLLKGDQDKTLLFIEKNTDFKIKWEGASLTKEEASALSGIDAKSIFYLDDFDKVFNQTMNYARSIMGTPPVTLYLDLYHESVKKKPVSLSQAANIVENYPELNIKSVNAHISYLRMFKTDEEIEEIKQAIAHTKKGLDNVLANIKTRTHEYQLQADFLHAITLDGSEGYAFDTIAACGKNATVLHYTDNKDTLDHNEMILFDLGALHNNYASDISRTYPVGGAYSKRQKEIYQAVLDVNKKSIDFVKPGVTWKELNDYAKDLLAKKAVKLGLIQEEKDIMNVYYHSIGHFMGLDVHDVGLYNQPLEAGMVLTIEPGLYTSEEGIGVRIEDDILVTEDGCVNLSEAIIKEVDDIEKAIKGS